MEALESRLAMAVDLQISEFLALNSNDPGNLRDEDGASSDWIEIHNTTGAAIDLAGWRLTDDALDPDKWEFPSRSLAAGGYLVVFASNKDRTTGPNLHTNFELNGNTGEYLALVRPDGTIAHEYAPTYPEQVTDVSFGVADVVGSTTSLVASGATAQVLVPTAADAALDWRATEFDSSGWGALANGRSGPQGVGFEMNDPPGFTTLVDIGAIGGRVEPGSNGNQPGGGVNNINNVNLAQRNITSTTGQVYTLAIDNIGPAGTAVGTIDWRDRGNSTAVGSLVWLAEDHLKNNLGIVRMTLGSLPAGAYTMTAYLIDPTASQSEAIRILVDNNNDGTYADTGVVGSALYSGAIPGVNGLTTAIVQERGATFSFQSDGVNPVRILFNGTAAVDTELPLAGFTLASVGGPYSSVLGTDVTSVMHTQNASAWIRVPFAYSGGAALDQLRLRMRYDDGFVAYLNGTEIARRNAPGTAGEAVAFDATATASRTDSQSMTFEEINVTPFASLLLTDDTNVLAIHGLNLSAADDDFLAQAELAATTVTPGVQQYFSTPTPGAANVSGSLGFVEDTKFSHNRGFYDAPFDVTITTDTPGAVIRYTTDGSWPTASTGTVYAGPITVNRTTILKAAAFKPGFTATNADTQSYIFLANTLTQTGAGLPAFTAWGHAGADWAVDPNVVNHAVASNRLTVEDMRSVPTMLVSTNWTEMFGPAGTGIYIAGAGVERQASIEMIMPDGTTAFEIVGSTEIQGGTSDDRWKDDKLSMQLKFKEPWGPTKLQEQIFGPGTTTSFDTLILDGVLNWSWVHATDAAQRAGAKYLTDQFVADVQNRMGGFAPHAKYVHLYLNGLYWGMYYMHERPDETYQSDYQGGDKSEWHVIKHNPTTVVNHAVGANATTDYNNLLSLANADLTVQANYEAVAQHLDIDGFADYLLANWYSGNTDWPAKNWYASRRNAPGGKWRFHSWDAEHTLRDAGGPAVNVNVVGQSPNGLHARLNSSPEYRLRFADRVRRHFFNDGALTPTVTAAMFQARMTEIDRAIVGESARWGDNSAPLKTRADWLNNVNALITGYFPNRTGVVLGQLRSAGLYPTLDAPNYSQHGGEVAQNYSLGITDPNATTGTIYYTLDGTDPRVPVMSTTTGTTLLAERSAVTFKVPTIADAGVQTTWMQPGASTAGWNTATAGVGYDRDTAAVNYLTHLGAGANVESAMYNINTSVWTRYDFNATNPASFTSMTLQMKYDDAFVAYLNGFEIARSSQAPAGALAWNSAATTTNADANAIVFQAFDVSAHLGRLLEGNNVLAIQAMNNSLTSSDLLNSPQLTASTTQTNTSGISPTAIQYTGAVTLPDATVVKARVLRSNVWSALTQASFSVDLPIRVTELYYNPPGNSEAAEFLELMNVGATTVDLTGLKFVRGLDGSGIDYEFLATDTVRTLAPGARLVIAGNRVAFQAAYPWVPAAALADRQYLGNLDNGGEALTLVDEVGGTQQTFTYDDLWHPTTDGDGLSLVLIDPSANESTWNAAASWQPSRELGGSPGEPDRLMGDANGDDRVDLLDLGIVQSNLGAAAATWPQGDFTRDGAVSRQDVLVVLQNYTRTYTPPPSPAPSPTPGLASVIFQHFDVTLSQPPGTGRVTLAKSISATRQSMAPISNTLTPPVTATLRASRVNRLSAIAVDEALVPASPRRRSS